MTHCLHAFGSVCYDETGVTFPDKVPIDWASKLQMAGITRWEWRNELGQSNLPAVLCFQATDQQAKALDGLFPYSLGLIVRTIW
jgi:hypothetical protein